MSTHSSRPLGAAPDRAVPVRSPQRFRARYGPWAVVTGASSGIGRALAESLAATGVNTVLVARRADTLHELSEALTSREPIQTRVVAADLTASAGLDAVYAATSDLDIGLLVTAAGFGSGGLFLDADLADEQTMLALNCGAVLAMTHHYGRRLAGRGRGGIVLLASLVGRQGAPWAAHYAATKSYIQVLGEGLHRELGARHIDVLVTAPGPVHSGFADRAGMHMRFAAQPAQIATTTLNALGRGAVVSPGVLSKTLTWSLAPLPRPIRTTIMSAIMRDMAVVPATSGPDSSGPVGIGEGGTGTASQGQPDT